MKNSKIAYIMSFFPKLTETFILFEILDMEEFGVTVEIYPLRRGRESVTHAEVDELMARAHYHPFLSLPILRSQWYYLRRCPKAYFTVLAEVLKGTFGSIKFFIGALSFFPKSVHFAHEMAELEIDHIHAHFASHATVAALIINRLTGIPFSFTAHGSDIHVDQRMLKEKIEASAFAITVSDYNKEFIVDACGPHIRDKIQVVHGGIDTSAFSPRIGSNPDGKFQILCIARFEEVKGHVVLIEACRLLQERSVDFECHLIGDGHLRPKTERLIEDGGLNGKVILWGKLNRPEVIERLGKATVVVLATVLSSNGKREGIPTVLMEGMACGLPVVSSSISGIPELVEHDYSGLLLPPGDAVALANAFQRLNADPLLRDQMGQAGREKILRDFNLQDSTAKRVTLFTARSTSVGEQL
jgi:colanic acid/amylovoran biosynthesis glycosyltransferase